MVTPFLFTKNTWIGDLGASCHITNNNTGLYDVTNIDESIQGSSRILPTMKKGKPWFKVHQVNGTEQVHILWPVKFFPKAGANLFYLTWEHLKEKRIACDHHNNIVVNSSNDNIILDCQIKTRNGWVARVKFLCKANNEITVSATALLKKNVNDLHVELGHPSKTITHSNAKAIGIQVTGTFKLCEDCTLGKAK